MQQCFPLQTHQRGWGVVALEPLEKGEFIVEYVGEGKLFLHGHVFLQKIEAAQIANSCWMITLRVTFC
jgi:hypothetical protein